MTVAAKPLSPQCADVLNDLQLYDSGITSFQAWRILGISRLGARIWELRHEHGYEIKSKMVSVMSRNGGHRWVKRYWLAEK